MGKISKKQIQHLEVYAKIICEVEKYIIQNKLLPDEREDLLPIDIARAMVADYGAKALNYVKSYRVCMYGVKFERIDSSLRALFAITDPTRVRALLNTALNLYMKSGSTRIEYSTLINYIRLVEKRAGAEGMPIPPVIILATIIDSNPRFEIVKDHAGIVWIAEAAAAAAEASIATSVRVLNARDGISVEAEDIDDSILSTEQRKAVLGSMRSGISIITGPSGSGKTTVANVMCTIAERNCRPIVLVAPTNVAAKRLREKTGRTATTIHSALGIIPCLRTRTMKDLPKNAFVVVDEVSMVDCLIFDVLLDSVRKTPGATIVVMGDDEQLTSVGPGAVLRDLIESGKVHTSILSMIFRQGNETDLFRAVEAIRRKEPFFPTEGQKDPTFIVKKLHAEQSLVDDVVACYRAIINKNPNIPASEIRILCPVRSARFDITVKKINCALHDVYYKDTPTIDKNGYKISVGEPIVIITNHPDLDLYNGDLVKVIGIDNGLRVKDGERIIDITPTILTTMRLELAYATTVHKSQGAEAAVIIVVLPSDEKLKGLLTTNLIYVASSRARKLCVVISQEAAYEKAVKNAGKPRITGLQDKLAGGNKSV